jgi:hypothetical protein
VDGNAFAAGDCGHQPIRGTFEACQPERIVELIQRRIHEARGFVRIRETAHDKQAGGHRRHLELIC